MAYRVSTKPNGGRRWWTEDETIPADHMDVREATPTESKLIADILAGDASSNFKMMDDASEKLRAMWLRKSS